VRDLAALGLDILLRLREVLGGRLGLESDLHEISTLSSSIALDIRCIE
jgi:light-regulated signal transduction histidine kinase (bacteriophytochrome)